MHFQGLLKAGLQSSTIMSVADVATQLMVERTGTADYDIRRTLRFTLAGLTLHGPYFFAGFSALDKRFGPATSLMVVAKKTAAAQFILFPPYLVALFGLMGILEQHHNLQEKIATNVPDAFLNGCIYWPIANGINFAAVPASLRVPYLAASAGVWNSYLSWQNAKGKKNTKDPSSEKSRE